jgi:hypothetical protein
MEKNFSDLALLPFTVSNPLPENVGMIDTEEAVLS